MDTEVLAQYTPDFKRVLFIPDTHVDAICEKSYSIIFKMIQMMVDAKELDRIVFLGDLLDVHHLSSHQKDDRIGAFYYEIVAAQELLKKIRGICPDTPIVWIEGNHEARLEKYCKLVSPDLKGIVPGIPELCELDKLAIEWVPYGHEQAYKVPGMDGLIARHEPLRMGQTPAASTLKFVRQSIIFGHTHRMEYARTSDFFDNDYEAICPGHVVDDRSKNMSYCKGWMSWSKGVAVGSYDDEGWFIDLVPFKNNRAQFDGMLFTA